MAMVAASRRWLLKMAAGRGRAVRSARALQELATSKPGNCGISELSRDWSSSPAGAGRPLPWLRLLPHTKQMSCCAGVDAPRAPEIIVEYDAGLGDNNDYFIRLADDIEDRFPELSVLGNPEEVQPRTGSFEVTRDGQVLFSMLQAKRRPTLAELIHAIENLEVKCEMTSQSSAASG